MRKHNIVGTSRGFVDRILASYGSVTPEKVRKYFLSSLKFMKLYLEGETGCTVNKKMAKIRKSHRGPAQFDTDHSDKNYNRNRLQD